MKKFLVCAFFVGLILVCFNMAVFAETGELTTTTTAQIPISEAAVNLSGNSFPFRARAIEPGVTVTHAGRQLVRNVDFRLTFRNNINAGTARATVTAIQGSGFTGEVSRNFSITPIDISRLGVRQLNGDRFVFTGSEIRPAARISGGGHSPVAGRDFTITYRNNVNTGVATATIRGIGNFTGSFTRNFVIVPQQVTGLRQDNTRTDSVRLNWNSVGGNITGYMVYQRVGNNWRRIQRTRNTRLTIRNLRPGTGTRFAVRAYRNSGGSARLGARSASFVSSTRPPQTVTRPSSFRDRNFVVRWDGARGASGYEIQFSRDRNFRRNVRTRNSGAQARRRNIRINRNVTYYYRVRAFRNHNNRRLNGAWSQRRTTHYTNVLGSFATSFRSPAGRTANIRLSARHINGTVLRPGEVFSFNQTVGRRTRQRGFRSATIFVGNERREGYGGGICQVSTTVFNAALNANLGIVERHAHSMRVDYVAAGRDAAVSWGGIDLRVRNDFDFDIRINARVYNNSRIVVQIVSNSIRRPTRPTINVAGTGENSFVLRRRVNGRVNFTTRSRYVEPRRDN